MKLKNIIGICIVSILIFSSFIWATEARYIGLNSNITFEDDTNIFLFPSLLPNYANSLYINLASLENGYGGIIYGKENSIGVFFNRPTELGVIDNKAPFWGLEGTKITDLPNTLFNLLFAIGGGTSSSVGVNLHFGIKSYEREIISNNNNQEEDKKDNLTAISMVSGGTISHTYKDEGNFETSNALNINLWYKEDNIEPMMSFALIDRTSFTLSDNIALVLFPYFEYVFTTLDIGKDEEDDIPKAPTLSSYRINCGIGPKFTFLEDLTIGTQFGFFLNYFPGNKDLYVDKETLLYLPAVNIAGEYTFKKNFSFRVGMTNAQQLRYKKEFVKKDDKVTEEDTPTESESIYIWNAGIGYKYKNFQIDGAIQPKLFFDGPNVIGGKSPGFLTFVSTSYTF